MIEFVKKNSIDFVCIYCEKDIPYLQEMINSIPKNYNLYLFKTTQSNIDLINEIEIKDNLFHYELFYKELNFSNFRNKAKSKCKNDIIFMIDSDERLLIESSEIEKIKEIFNNSKVGGLKVNIINFSFENNGLHKHIAPTVRIFKKEFVYENRVHENIEADILRNNYQILDSTVILKHIGYLTTLDNNFERMQRNVNLMYKDLADNPDNRYLEYKLYNSINVLNEMRKANDNNK